MGACAFVFLAFVIPTEELRILRLAAEGSCPDVNTATPDRTAATCRTYVWTAVRFLSTVGAAHAVPCFENALRLGRVLL